MKLIKHMWNLALLGLFCFRYSFQDDSVTSQQNFDGSTSIKDDSTDDTNEQDDIYSFHSDEDDFTTVTYVEDMQCREGFSTRADLQYPNELYTLAVNGSSDDPNKALHGFPFGRVTFTYHQSTFEILKFINDGMSDTVVPRYFSASALFFRVIGASKIEIVLRNGIIITFRLEETLNPYNWNWIRFPLAGQPIFEVVTLTFELASGFRKMKLFDFYMQACCEDFYDYYTA